jgi:hypothetical protein
MLDSTAMSDANDGHLWSRSDRLCLSAAGRTAESAYRSTIVASRTTGGRASYDAARAEWAEPLTLQPDDGIYLGALEAGPRRFAEVVDALDDCGKTADDAKKSLRRLMRAGLVEIVR